VLVVAAIGWLVLRPSPQPVSLATAERGPLAVTVEEEGRTRVRERYDVSAPVDGWSPRITLKAGDAVTGGEVLLALEPAPAARLEELRERGVRVARYRGPGYPLRLVHLHQPPPALYLHGPLDLEERAVAVVGTRSATSYGRRAARDLAGDLARAGWVVVSGLARGIDTAAHRAALDAGGKTAAVLGSGAFSGERIANAEEYNPGAVDGGRIMRAEVEG
jgi:DNA processing protein